MVLITFFVRVFIGLIWYCSLNTFSDTSDDCMKGVSIQLRVWLAGNDTLHNIIDFVVCTPHWLQHQICVPSYILKGHLSNAVLLGNTETVLM